ncbi:MAG: hypothetical protein Kow00127_12680 [Bacteroidales bacterium]
MNEPGQLFHGEVIQEHAFIRFPEGKQRYWTPEMHVWVREEDGKTIVYGVVGPKPRIWTMFMFFYVAIITTWFFGSSYGLIQLFLGMKAPFLWSIPLGLAGVAIVYAAARFGQKRGRDEMNQLVDFTEKIVRSAGNEAACD